jgi:general L-amino acid transport system permease protein
MTDTKIQLPAKGSWFYSPKFRGITSQVVVLLLLAWGLYELVMNTQANLERQNQNFGYDFFGKSSGFDLSTSLIPFTSTSTYGRAIVAGFLNTLMVSVLGIIFATILGFIIGVMRLSKNWLVSRTAYVYVEIIRNIPLVLHLLIWYALVLKPLPGPKQAVNFFDSVFLSNRGLIMPHPQFGPGAWLAALFFALALVASYLLIRWARLRQEKTGERFPSWWIAILGTVASPFVGLVIAGWPLTFDYPALAGFNFKGGMTFVPEGAALLAAISIYTASFIAEVVRSGIQAVSHGQTEAASALGLRNNSTLRLVVIPQALRVIIPPLASQYLNLIKNSSLAVLIGYPDFFYTSGIVINQSGKTVEMMSIIMVVYLTLSLVTSAFMNWYNERMRLVER